MGSRRQRDPITRRRCAARRSVHATGLVLVSIMAAVLVFPGAASPASACGLAVLSDWFDDGRVGRLYALPCYEEAIEAIPGDLRDYSDAEEVISRALQAATRGKLAPGTGVDPTAVDALRPGDRARSASLHGAPIDRPATAAPDSSGASSLPIRLIVLGGMSLVLLAAGGLGHMSRRRDDADASRDWRG